MAPSPSDQGRALTVPALAPSFVRARPSSTSTLAARHASISGPDYLAQLSRFIQTHERALAEYYAPRSATNRPASSATLPSSPPPPSGTTAPSWTAILSLGILPDASHSQASQQGPTSTRPPPRPASNLVRPRREPLVLEFDPHHLYYLLLKFDELALSTGGELDVKVEHGLAKPMTVDYSAVDQAGLVHVEREGSGGPTPSLFASVFGGFGGGGGAGNGGPNGVKAKNDDSRSVTSGKSSFSFGSGWWGLGGGGGGGDASSTSTANAADEATQVRYIYSSCTKLPALKLSPFVFSPSPPTSGSTPNRTPNRHRPPQDAVEGFEDCPPPSTCVPLALFHGLTSLYLADLDPRAFTGWDVLSIQLKKLEVVRGGIEDVGELICDCVVEDERRSRSKREHDGTGHGGLASERVGEGRRRRAEGASLVTPGDDSQDPSTQGVSTDPDDSYPVPSKLAWSSLRHLSLHDNSLTFLPSRPLAHLPYLTSLDLSSNLLISVPPALSSLPNLRSLNLSDNMIENLHSLPTILGAVEVLNLSHNRLENLSGLDRLLALERLDLRSNRIWEALELSRVARLPRLREVWVKDNPFARDRDEGGEEQWRVKCLAYFEEERIVRLRAAEMRGEVAGADEVGPPEGLVKLDGKGIEGRGERKLVELEVAKRIGGAYPSSSDHRPRRRASAAGLQGNGVGVEHGPNGIGVGVAPVKVVEGRRRVVTAPMRQRQTTATTTQSTETDGHASPAPSLSSSPVLPSLDEGVVSSSPKSNKGKAPARRRKPKRIVDLDGNNASQPAGVAAQAGGAPPASVGGLGQFSDSDATATTSSGPEVVGATSKSRQDRPLETVVEPPATRPGPSTPSKRTTTSHQRFASSPSHSRISPVVGAGSDDGPTFSSIGPSGVSSPSKNRRDRVSASTFEAGEGGSSGGQNGPGGGGEALRRKIEKLREEVGENWLSVLSEREARAQQQQQRQEQEAAGCGAASLEDVRTSPIVDRGLDEGVEAKKQDEPPLEGLAVSAGVKVVKKKAKKKRGTGK